MPPWSGVEEAEVVRRVGGGETLPPVSGSPPSLVTYLTQYGLKWNSHERELDLQEIHTMLRSLRVRARDVSVCELERYVDFFLWMMGVFF